MDGGFPPDVLSMSNQLGSPQYLVCPSDRKHRQVLTWAEFDPRKNLSYEYLKPNFDPRKLVDPSKAREEVVFRCPIHHIVAFADGSVGRQPVDASKRP